MAPFASGNSGWGESRDRSVSACYRRLLCAVEEQPRYLHRPLREGLCGQWQTVARGIAEIGGKTAECIGALSSLIPSSRSSDVTRPAPAEDVTRGSSGIRRSCLISGVALRFSATIY